jgi:uncharacterized membrane protein
VEDTLHIIFIWVHILGLVLFLGPQFFLAFAWVPTSRGITDMPTRIKAMRTVTRRFGWIGGIGLLLLLIGGGYLIGDWRKFYNVPDSTGFFDYYFGSIFVAKMIVLVVMLILLALHTFYTGPKLIDAMEGQAAGRAVSDLEVRRLRVQSMMLSISVLVLTLVIMVAGVMLNTTTFSFKS